MKSYTLIPWNRLISQTLIVMMIMVTLISPCAHAQDAEIIPPANQGADGDGGPEEKSDGEADGEKEADDGLVAVNLKNVNVDKLVQFLGEITGKAVLKHKDVKVGVTVYSQERVTPRQAFALLSDALLLEKVAIVEDRDTIKIIPIEMLSEVVVELRPEDAEDALGGIIKNVISIQFSDVKDIETMVKPLMSPAGSLLVHPTSRKIIVTDTARRVAAIRGIIAEVDMLDTHQRKVKVFELQHATAEEIAPILKSVLTTMAAKANGGAPPKPGGQPQQQGQNKQKNANAAGGVLEVVAYKTANWVVVVAPEELVQAAIALVDEFDREKPEAVSLHFLPVIYASPDEIARELGEVFSKGPDKRVKDIVEISSDSRSNSLIILSSDENYAKIKELVAQIDTEESVKMMTRTYELVHADAGDIAEQMNELYQGLEKNSGRSYWWSSRSRNNEDEKTRFVPEPRTNTVIAIGRPTEFPKIEEMIAKLDQPIDADEVKPRIYRMKFIDAQEVTEVLNDVFGSGDSESSGGYYDYWYGGNDDKSADIGRLYGKVNFVTVTSSNSIIVMTNNTENFKIIGDFIDEIDQVSPDAANTIVINLQYAQATELADKLNSLYAKQGSRMPQGQQKDGEEQDSPRRSYFSWLYGSPKDKDDKRTISNLIGQVRVVPDQRTNSLMVTTAAQNFALLRDLVAELDVESPKVLVSVRLLEITTTKIKRIGTRYSSDSTTFENDDLDNGLRSNFGITWNDVSHNGTISTSAGIDMGLVVQFLRRNADTRILSDTTIAMNNNEAAKIFVGTQIPFITNSQSTPEGGLTNSFEYKDAGTSLNITPNINSVDRVEMNIELEASQIRTGEVILGGQVIDTRQFNTNIAVADGDTVVIGGIMRESESDAVRGVPILGKIPVANLVFRKKDGKHEITELIAFITPTILRGDNSDVVATKEAVKKLPNINEWRPLEEEPEAPKRKGLFRKMKRHGRTVQ